MGKKKYYETEEFLELNKKWKKKLERAGFEDIEFYDEETGEYGNLLRGFSAMDALKTWSPEQEEYYSMCRRWLWHLRKKRAGREVLKIWSLYSEGMSYNAISKKLKMSRKRVTQICKSQEADMLAQLRGND